MMKHELQDNFFQKKKTAIFWLYDRSFRMSISGYDTMRTSSLVYCIPNKPLATVSDVVVTGFIPKSP